MIKAGIVTNKSEIRYERWTILKEVEKNK